jgi:hypothetical protein
MFRAALWPALLCVLLYASGLGSGFIYDDETLLVDSTRLVTATPKLAFTSDFWGLSPRAWRSLHYRPLAMLTYSGVYRLFGISPFAFHSANILFHAAATASFYWLLLALGYSMGVSMAAALLFAAHPLHVESVEWMSGMTETQVSALMLGSLACFAYGRRRWSLLLAAAAMLTKEAALILPALIFVLALMYCSEQRKWPKWRAAILAAIPYVVLAAIYLALRAAILPRPPKGALWKVLREAWPAIPGSAAYYLKAVFWPWPLSINYELPGISMRLVMLMVVGLWIVAMLNLPSLRDDLALSGALILLPLVIPVLTSPLMVHWLQAQDRYAYLATSGACLIVAVLLSRLPYHGLFMGCLFLVSMGALGVFLQLYAWESNETLWTHTLEITPNSKPAALNLAYTMYVESRFTEAEVVYRKALRYHPNDPEIMRSLIGMRTHHPVPDPNDAKSK